jgi:dCTP deaminase
VFRKLIFQSLSVILTDTDILSAIHDRSIVIEPFREDCLGSNSYDVHLGKTLAVYREKLLDAKQHNEVEDFEIPDEGFVLLPERLYLGVTEEYTETHRHVPFLEGKSSVGRLGIDIHATAGKGDVGFANFWTLEMSVRQPVRLYAGMPIGQLIYFETSGEASVPYSAKPSAKYTERSQLPTESMMFKNWNQETKKWK